jgi:hypothetical protein
VRGRQEVCSKPATNVVALVILGLYAIHRQCYIGCEAGIISRSWMHLQVSVTPVEMVPGPAITNSERVHTSDLFTYKPLNTDHRLVPSHYQGITFAFLMRSNAVVHVSLVPISSVYPTLCEASMLIWRSKSNIVIMKYWYVLTAASEKDALSGLSDLPGILDA